MKRPDAAMALLKWKPGALLVLRALRDGCAGPFAGLSDAMACQVLSVLSDRGLISFTLIGNSVRAPLLPLGIRALAWYDMESRQARTVLDDGEPDADEPAPLDFDGPHRLPAFAFGAGK